MYLNAFHTYFITFNWSLRTEVLKTNIFLHSGSRGLRRRRERSEDSSSEDQTPKKKKKKQIRGEKSSSSEDSDGGPPVHKGIVPFNVVDPHHVDVDPDPQIRIGKNGSGSSSW